MTQVQVRNDLTVPVYVTLSGGPRRSRVSPGDVWSYRKSDTSDNIQISAISETGEPFFYRTQLADSANAGCFTVRRSMVVRSDSCENVPSESELGEMVEWSRYGCTNTGLEMPQNGRTNIFGTHVCNMVRCADGSKVMQCRPMNDFSDTFASANKNMNNFDSGTIRQRFAQRQSNQRFEENDDSLYVEFI
jgi:hypothetical protein